MNNLKLIKLANKEKNNLVKYILNLAIPKKFVFTFIIF